MNKKGEGVRQRKPEIKEIRRNVTNNGKPARKNKRKISTASNATKPAFHRIWTRTVIIFCVMVVVYFFAAKEKERKFATVQERNLIRFQNITCSSTYLQEVKIFPQCVPSYCGRFVNDRLIQSEDVETLLEIAKNGIALGGSSGGASILDLNSGALSKGKHFVDIYNMSQAKDIFKEEHLLVYKNVKSKIKKAVAEQFRIDENSLYPTYPSFFSRITNTSAKTIHDEYWHSHVDKETYEAFHYTSLLYLTDYGKDFNGGRFVFVDKKANMTIEPVRGRVSGFTSGAENLHYVEKVTYGTRYALTVSFTCNPKMAVADPKFPRERSQTPQKVNLDPGNDNDQT